MNILLADDDPKIHLILKMWLNRNGHNVDCVQDGQAALHKLNHQTYDGLITDMNMPLMKGVDLINALSNCAVKPQWVILLTSRCDLNDIKNRISGIEVSIFNKPFSPAALTEVINGYSEGIQ